MVAASILHNEIITVETSGSPNFPQEDIIANMQLAVQLQHVAIRTSNQMTKLSVK